MPGLAFPPAGPLGLGSPRSSVLCAAKTALMLFPCRFALRSLHRHPGSFPLGFVFLKGSLTSRGNTCQCRGSFSPGCPCPVILVPGTHEGSLKFPNYPYEYMPCSRTPVVSSLLAMAQDRTAAFRIHNLRRLSLSSGGKFILTDHNNLHFGAQSHGLHPHYSRLRTVHY